MNIAQLIEHYQTDPDSPLQTLRHATRLGYARLSSRMAQDIGAVDLATLSARDILRLHKQWVGAGHYAMAHSIITHLRILVGFGATILEDADCQRVRTLLAGLRFKNGGARSAWLTRDQAENVRDCACIEYHFAISLAQAFQADCALRQKDVIGEWVPLDDPEPSTIIDGDVKWVRGLTREEISAELVLSHKTSKRGKVQTFDLRKCPMVMEDWECAPVAGPLIIDFDTKLPFHAWKFRREWRRIANLAGVPRNVWNMDTRSGRITNVLASGALPNDVRLLAGHSQLSTTMRYARGTDDGIDRALSQATDKEDAKPEPIVWAPFRTWNDSVIWHRAGPAGNSMCNNNMTLALNCSAVEPPAGAPVCQFCKAK